MSRNSSTVTIGDNTVVVRRSGRSTPIVAGLLGMDGPTSAPQRLYLDRRIHLPGEQKIGAYRVTGAVSTVLVHDPD